MKRILLIILSILLSPYIIAYFFYSFTHVDNKLKQDICRYKEHKGIDFSFCLTLVYLLLKYDEFRNIYYHRLGKLSKYFLFILRERSDLHIWTPSNKIGGGLYIGHGWGTVVNASEIGENCLIGQNVTIGSRNVKEPVIGDNVSIWAHAVVIGDIRVGDNSQIGAGAVVVKNVPSNAVVVGAKSQIIRINGEKVNIVL